MGELNACPTRNELFSGDIDLGEPQSSTKHMPAWLLGVAVTAASPPCHVAAGRIGDPPCTPPLLALLSCCAETMLDAWLNETLAFNTTTCTLAFQNLTLCSTDKGSNSTGSNTTSL